MRAQPADPTFHHLMVTRSLMWPASLFVSLALHVILLVAVGANSGSQLGPPAKPFSLIDFPPSLSAVTQYEKIGARIEAPPKIGIGQPKLKREDNNLAGSQAEAQALALEVRSPPFYKSSEVSHGAQLQLPLEGIQFSEELSLSGRLVLDIAVSDLGKVVSIEVIEASDVSGALRAHMLPLLKNAPFTPAYKSGRAVNSVRRVEFTLGVVLDDPSLGFNSSVSPGFRPPMDARGNTLNDPRKP